MKKSLATLGARAAAALFLSGCTDSDAAPEPTETMTEGTGELTTVRVAALPIAET